MLSEVVALHSNISLILTSLGKIRVPSQSKGVYLPIKLLTGLFCSISVNGTLIKYRFTSVTVEVPQTFATLLGAA